MDEKINEMPQQENKQSFETNPNMQTQEKGSKGALIGTAIIIILLLVVGAYVFLNRPQAPTQGGDEIMGAQDGQLESLQMQGNSNEITDIEADVNATNLTDIDAELNAIDQELQAEGL